jgi:hypothetical protein
LVFSSTPLPVTKTGVILTVRLFDFTYHLLMKFTSGTARERGPWNIVPHQTKLFL